jgi:hypothetical protein
MAGCIVRTNRRGGPADWLALCPHAEVRAPSAFHVRTSRWEHGISTVSALSNRSSFHVPSCLAVRAWMPVALLRAQ